MVINYYKLYLMHMDNILAACEIVVRVTVTNKCLT